MNKKWWLPSKLTRRRVGNQATMVQCLQLIVRDWHSIWKQGGGAPNPKETSSLRLNDATGISTSAEERTGFPGRGQCLYTDRRNHQAQAGKPKHRNQSVLVGCGCGKEGPSKNTHRRMGK